MSQDKTETWKADFIVGKSTEELLAEVIDIESEDSRVCVDLNDAEHPIMVERDGWMALDDARWLRDLLNKAIAIVEAKWPQESKPQAQEHPQ